MRVPISGEAGVGCVMRRGYDLPPLMFDDDELEALAVGLALVARTGDVALVARATIRDERKVRLTYLDRQGEETVRTIPPLALAYFSESTVIAAWCEARRDFRHFRADRVVAWRPLPNHFKGEHTRLTKAWLREQKRLDAPVELAWSPGAL